MVIIIKYVRNAIVATFGLIIFGLIFSFVPVSYYRLQPIDPTKEETNLYSLAVNVKESTVSDFILSIFDSSDDFIKKTLDRYSNNYVIQEKISYATVKLSIKILNNIPTKQLIVWSFFVQKKHFYIF